MVYTAFSLAGSVISTRSIAQFTQFTFVTVMQNQLGLFGFYSMILFGALYYIVPRLLNRQWLFPKLVEAHFWSVVVGFVLLVFDLAIGGLIQGFGLEDPQIPMIAVNDLLGPFLAIQKFRSSSAGGRESGVCRRLHVDPPDIDARQTTRDRDRTVK